MPKQVYLMDLTKVEPVKLTDEQVAQLRRLRAFRPFLIAYGAVHPETKEFRMGSASNMRRPNNLARKGWHVEVLK